MNFTLMQKEKRTDVPLSEYNPYLAARREWDERYGDQITRAKNWRTMATLSALVALLATSGVVWLSVRSHVVPFVGRFQDLQGLIDEAHAQSPSWWSGVLMWC